MRYCHFVAVVLTLFVLLITVWAQFPTATVNGLVRDPSGTVVPGVDLHLVDEQKDLTYFARTNSEGIYSFSNLPPGTYRIQVSKAGFKTIMKPDIVLNPLEARAVNFYMPVVGPKKPHVGRGGADRHQVVGAPQSDRPSIRPRHTEPSSEQPLILKSQEWFATGRLLLDIVEEWLDLIIGRITAIALLILITFKEIRRARRHFGHQRGGTERKVDKAKAPGKKGATSTTGPDVEDKKNDVA